MLNVTVINKKIYGISNNIAEFINKYIPVVGKVNESNSMAFLLFIAMVLCCILSPIYFFLEKRNLPMGISKDISKEFINDYLKQDICDEMEKKIDRFDKEFNWLDRYFVPLKADVEIKRKNGKHKKVVDLLAALKKCHQRSSPIYLLIGEPGAGKSVALRKLCRELLKEVDKSGKIPLYINLKEWNNLSELLHKSDMPTQEQLVEFIMNFLCNGATYSLVCELEDKFVSYIQQGRWFFIFDSFDEIPCLLNLQKPDMVIEHLSGLLYDFLLQHNCGGIVASRPYRSPVASFKTNVVLTIRPMDEDKINKFFSKYTKNSKRLLKNIYHEKIELINLLRNPFYASLILNYYNHKKKLPSGQTDMFNDFVDMRLESCSKKLKKAKLKKEDVIIGACEIANCMFECESGLEVSTYIIKEKIGQDVWIDNVIDILCCAKVCRISEGEEPRVTFVHRRFQEYFLVLYLINQRALDESFYTDIEHNTRMHDALLFYCEIISDEAAEKIALHCWNIIQNNGTDYENIRNINTLYAVNCMLFLKEAFINRRNCLEGFLKEFQTLISEALNMRTDVVCLAKIAECICLFESKHLDLLLFKLFDKKYLWISEIALKSCVSFCSLNRKIEYCYYNYFSKLKDKDFLNKYWNFKFIFSTYKSYGVVKIYMRMKMFDIITTWLAYIGIAYLIFDGKMFDFLYTNISNRTVFFLNSCLIVFYILMDVAKYALPRHIILLYFILLTPQIWWLVLFSVPAHTIYRLLRFGWLTDKNTEEIIEELEGKNNVLKNFYSAIIYIIVEIILIFILSKLNILNIIIEIFGISYGIFFLIIIFRELFKVVFILINKFRCRRYKNRKTDLVINRSDLENELRSMNSKEERSAYLDNLIENNVLLSGNWRYNNRPSFGDENVARLLAMLDIKDLNIKL